MTTKSAKGHNFVSWFCCRACCLPYCRLIAFICLACCLFYYLFSYLYCWLYCRLFCRLFRKLCGHKVFIGNTCRQFACLFQNVFQKLKAFFFKYGVILPCILVLLTAYDNREFIHRCFFKLGLYGFGYFFG